MRGSDLYSSRSRGNYQSVSVDKSQWEKLAIDMEYERLAQKAIKGEIKLSIRSARKVTISRLRGIVGRTGKNPIGDPRGAARAVKATIYRGGGRSSDGGNLSILNRKGAARGMKLWQPKKGGKSGIERKRNVSKRTEQVNSYRGADRAFILRFLDLGTEMRRTDGVVSALEKHHRKKGWKPTREGANRGQIPAGNFFGKIAKDELEKETLRLSTRIYKLIEEVAQGK